MDPLALIIAAPSSGDPLVDWLTQVGPIGILAFLVIAFMRGWIVPGSSFNRVIAERNRALQINEDAVVVTRKALEAGLELKQQGAERNVS